MSEGTIDLSDAACVKSRKPLGPHNLIQAGRKQAVGDISLLAAGNGTDVGTGLLKAVGFREDDPGASVIETKARLGPSGNLDRQSFVGGRRVGHRKDCNQLLAILGRCREQNAQGRSLLPSSTPLLASWLQRKECRINKAGNRVR